MSIGTMTAQIAGDWKGSIDVMGQKLELIFHIEEENGKISATLDVPAQGATGLPLDKAEFSNPDVELAFTQAGLSYKGKLNDQTIEGSFTQSGMDFPLTLIKTVIEKPGDLSLPSSDAEIQKLIDMDKGAYKYSVADYFQKPKSSRFQLSPNGKYLSYMEKDANDKNHVYVKEVATGKVTRAIEEKEELIRGYGWINDNRLLYVMDKGGNENYHIYAADLDGSNQMDLTPYEGVQAMILSTSREIIVTLSSLD